MSRSLILGTAGHIDHGKTALVRALTGVDTDRLKEERERGITIDLGFAEWAGEDVHLGIIDVPGHEGFIRNMVAGATGMDVVLLVVAADEGVMPQTREHLSIVSLLGVERLVVALTKVDLVEEAWLELVRDEVRELLAHTPVADAEIVATSARTGAGLDELGKALIRVARATPEDEAKDVARLPVDRVFTVHGTGTVVTGTLWSGTLAVGQKVALRPDGPEARIRGLQVHGRDVEAVRAGHRTAVALAGTDVERATIDRGHTLVDARGWPATSMITVRLSLLGGTRWIVEHNQRIRVHLGTAEIMARVVLLGEEQAVAPGAEAWAQLRLETPAVARARERLVIRSYSPVTTIGGGTVVEPIAPKRSHLDRRDTSRLEALLLGDPGTVIDAALEIAGWAGLSRTEAPLVTGLTPAASGRALADAVERGALPMGDAVVAPGIVRQAAEALVEAVEGHHRAHPLRPGKPLETTRSVLPDHVHPELADAVLERLVAEARLSVDRGVVSLPGFEPALDARQKGVRDRLLGVYTENGLAPPSVDELPATLRDDPDLWPILKLLAERGLLTALSDDFFVPTGTLEAAVDRVRQRLGGRTDLGPADFREALPVTRKHLMPLLAHLDQEGVTVRRPGGREVPER